MKKLFTRPAAGRETPPEPAPAPASAKELADARRDLHRLTRQVAALQGIVAQQSDLLVEALRRAGWQSDAEADQQVALRRTLDLAKGTEPVIAGPWTGEVGFELLYWIPFLTWLVEQGMDPRRLVIVSRGGAAPWYRHLTDRYVDVLDLVTPDEFRERTAGPKKQVNAHQELDRELVDAATARLGLKTPAVVHPSTMYRLFSSLWRKRATVELVESFTSHRSLLPPASVTPDEPVRSLPVGYVAAKFYFSKAFPDTGSNRRFVGELLRDMSRRMPVALLSTAMRLDEHVDFQTTGSSGLHVVDAHAEPTKNLEVQTRVLCRARGFVGTYGGFSYLAPFYGVRSLSFFSRRDGFEQHHLQLAERVFDRLLPGGFLAVDRQAADLIQPAIDQWRTASLTNPAPSEVV